MSRTPQGAKCQKAAIRKRWEKGKINIQDSDNKESAV